MYTTSFLCPTCGNPDVSYASSRFLDIMKGNATNKEIFALLGIKSKYKIFLKEKRSNPDLSEKELLIKALNETGFSYKDFRQKKNERPLAIDVYKLLGIYKICCMRSVFCLPVWPNYSDQKPPGSALELDNGQVMRYVRQNKMKFEIGEISSDQYVETGRKFVPFDVKEDNIEVSDDKLRNLKV